MKLKNLFAAALAATLAACGGGGGGGSTTGTSTTSVACPDGTSASAAAACPAVAAPGGAQSGTNGITVTFTGALTNATAVLWKGAVGGTPVAGTSSMSTDMKTVKFVPTVRLAYGDQQYNLVITGTDSVGRTVQTTTSFSPGPMVCANNEVWSNPATFVSAYQACVAPIGVQTLMDATTNAMTDTSCTLTVGSPLSAACKAYAANGTLMFADTTFMTNSRDVIWIAYFGNDGSSNIALVDALTLSVVAKTVLARPWAWIIGNPTGAAIATKVGSAERREQLTYNGSSFGYACYFGC